MREESHNDEPRADKRTPHERFEELAKRLMAVPKPELDAKEQAWQASRKAKRKRR